MTKPAILMTGVGKRYTIVSEFARYAQVIAADPSPLAPAQYAAHVQKRVPLITDPAYIPTLMDLCAECDVKAVIPLTDLDIDMLAIARMEGKLPALVPDPKIARATYDKYETHLLLSQNGFPSPCTVLPGESIERFPVMVKPREGSGARSIFKAHDQAEAEFFIRYVQEPVMVQEFMDGEEFSIDLLCDLSGRCLNAIPRTMLESRGGESIKGQVIRDSELIDLGSAVGELLGVRGPCTVQVFRNEDGGLGITDINPRFGGACPAHLYAALPGHTYPELIVQMACGKQIKPHVGEFNAGTTFTRYYSQLELNGLLQPSGR